MDPLITTEELAARVGDPELRIVDATWFMPGEGRDASAEFEAGHIPGATFLGLDAIADPDSPLPNTLPSAEQFAAAVGALGIGEDSRIVLYDDPPHRTAARAWFVFRHFGAEGVAILDGGLAKWRAEGRPLEQGRATPSPCRFTPRERPGELRDLDEVRANLSSRAEQLLDARSAARFTGAEADPRPGVAPGHIPGSRHLHYARLFAPDGTWKRGPELRAEFEAAGVDLDRPLVATCGSGVTACGLLFGARLLGRDGALYDGSWSEWGADPTTPKATGSSTPADPPR